MKNKFNKIFISLISLLLICTTITIALQKDSKAIYATENSNNLHLDYNKYIMLYGYVDDNGEVVIPHKFYHAENFSDGLALVRNGDYNYG